MSRTAFVTGASTGIGRSTAVWLARRGWTVFAGVRRGSDADALRGDAPGIEPLLVDVTDRAQLDAAAAHVGERVGDAGLAGLVNNAGIGGGGPLETLDLAVTRQVLEVNLFGALQTTQVFLPLLRRGPPGRVVNVSSIGGRWAGPFLGPYHMSKWALEAASDSLRMELHPHGIHVAVVEPGTITTAIWDKADHQMDEMLEQLDPRTEALYGEALRAHARVIRGQTLQGVTADVVAEAIEHALSAAQPRTRYLVGPDARATALARWLLPDRLFDALIRFNLRRRAAR